MEVKEVNKMWYSNKDVVKHVIDKNNDIDNLKDLLKETLSLIQRQTSENVMLKQELGVIKEYVIELKDIVVRGNKTTDEIKHTKFIGQSMEVLPQIYDTISRMTVNAKRRKIINAGRHVGGRSAKGFVDLYNMLENVTGINVMENGKKKLNATVNHKGRKPDPSYINVIFNKGIEDEAVAIAMQILADK